MKQSSARSLIFIIIFLLYTTSQSLMKSPPVALLTGATGRTGQIVTKKLIQEGFEICIFCRDAQTARDIFGNENKTIQFYEGDIGDTDDIEETFATIANQNKRQLTHVVFMAGGEGADYRLVNYQGVAAFATQAATYESISNFVVISSAWATRPYSIASLLFNSIYRDMVPMASHYLGEQALRKAAAGNKLNYVILRAGGLNSDDRYRQKYPEAASMGLTYQQKDIFEFLGKAGRPGMCRSQLANAVVSAINIQGKYTVEVTGSGTIDPEDSTVYQTLVPDNMPVVSFDQEEVIMTIHTQAVDQVKNTAIAATLGGIGLMATFGLLQGILLVLLLDAAIVFLWSRLLAGRQAC